MFFLVSLCLSSVVADVTIDLSTAQLDQETGQFCVMQKVCIANPPESLTSAGCAAAFPPGCDCDPEADDPNESCPVNTQCVQCKCLPLGCDCDPQADDPNSFCPVDEVCKDCTCQPPFPPGCDCDPAADDPNASCSADSECVQCKCLPKGCDCDPSADDPNSFCASGDVCKDCTCQPPFPPGCDCDPLADDPDASCSANTQCVQCKCLPLGCDCDPQADDPNSFCPSGDICKDCKCQSPLPPGCDCDPDAVDPDYLCPADLRCVGCKCQNCPQSAGEGLGQGRDGRVKNPPLVFVIDTTKSVKPDKDSIFNLTSKVTARIMKDRINIPRFQLFTFNDYGREINRNVQLELDTDDVMAFDRATSGLVFESYNGGRDSKERMSQGLLVALQNASPKSLVVVFTDNGSKDLNLEREIIRLRKAKECEVFIVLTPAYEGKFNGPSLPSYGRMGKVFLINEVGADSFLRDVEVFEETNCI